MTLLLILGIFAIWLYAGWVLKRKGNLPSDKDIALGHHHEPSDAFYAQRRVSDREAKKWRSERLKIGRRK